jgi:PAS domain S-box-containing protein
LPLAIRGAIELKKEKEFAFKSELLNRKLSAAVEQSPSHIIITNTEGVIEYVNCRFTEVTGYTAEEAIGNKPSILKSGYHPREFYAHIWETLNSGLVWRGELLNRKKNGENYWEAASISPLKNSEGKITHFISVKEDISTKKKMEQELVEARIRAEQSDKLKTAFLQNISHEIRTPLNAITGFSSLLLDNSITDESKKEYIEIINNSCYQLISMMEDIITASRIDSHIESLIEKKVNLKSMFDQLYPIYKVKTSEKELDFEMEFYLNESEQNILTDDIKLNQIITNLLNNAIKFTRSGSVSCGCYVKDNFIEFFVKDTGIGIKPDMLTKIFERFIQATDEIHVEYGGRGLGLSISKSFVEFLGGKIWVKSETGKGSIFYFTIPFRKA